MPTLAFAQLIVKDTMDESRILQEARSEIAMLSASLPKEVDLLGLSTEYKTGAKVLMLREAIIWRMEELSRNALARLDDNDLVASAMLTRGVMETTAAVVYLDKLVTRGINEGITDDLDDKLTGFLTGSRIWEELGGAINVLTMIDAVEKVIPGYRRNYEVLCEYAHPNWSGTHGAYATINKETYTVTLSRGGRSPDNGKNMLGGFLGGSVGLFIGYYNTLGNKLKPFAEAVAKFYDAKAAIGEE